MIRPGVKQGFPGSINAVAVAMVAILMQSVFTSTAHAQELPVCLMQPMYRSIPFPEKGLTEAFEAAMEIPCKGTEAGAWTIGRSNQGTLFVHADGPAGSGRYWTITVGIGAEGRTEPLRGVCLQTATTGWRTLPRYKSPLVWNGDLDGDGRSELILWDSFPLNNDASPAAFGLIAWVYRLEQNASLNLDWGLSRDLALDIAESYRTELDGDEGLKALRRKAGEALEAFGRDECVVPRSEPESTAGDFAGLWPG